MQFSYFFLPLLTWFVVGVSKFLVNSIRIRRWAFDEIGYGGFPSNHVAICSAMVAYIVLREGIDEPATGVAAALLLVVVLDATDLRRKVGEHASILNVLAGKGLRRRVLRERIGHNWFEVLGGVLVGGFVAASYHFVTAGLQ